MVVSHKLDIPIKLECVCQDVTKLSINEHSLRLSAGMPMYRY